MLAGRLLQLFDEALRDGLYADPHPGNIFVDRGGTLWFLDFGAVGRLSPVVLESLQEMAIGFQLNDPVVPPASATDSPGATSPATATRCRRTSAWCSARASAPGASIRRR